MTKCRHRDSEDTSAVTWGMMGGARRGGMVEKKVAFELGRVSEVELTGLLKG